MNDGEHHISRYFGHIANQYQSYREKRLAPFGIGKSDFAILHQLIIHDRPMHLGEISMRTKTDRALIGRSAKSLVERDLIVIQDNPFHKTKKDAVLTDEGRRVAIELQKATLDWEQIVEQDIPVEDREKFFEMLAQVYAASETLAAE